MHRCRKKATRPDTELRHRHAPSELCPLQLGPHEGQNVATLCAGRLARKPERCCPWRIARPDGSVLSSCMISGWQLSLDGSTVHDAVTTILTRYNLLAIRANGTFENSPCWSTVRCLLYGPMVPWRTVCACPLIYCTLLTIALAHICDSVTIDRIFKGVLDGPLFPDSVQQLQTRLGLAQSSEYPCTALHATASNYVINAMRGHPPGWVLHTCCEPNRHRIKQHT